MKTTNVLVIKIPKRDKRNVIVIDLNRAARIAVVLND